MNNNRLTPPPAPLEEFWRAGLGQTTSTPGQTPPPEPTPRNDYGQPPYESSATPTSEIPTYAAPEDTTFTGYQEEAVSAAEAAQEVQQAQQPHQPRPETNSKALNIMKECLSGIKKRPRLSAGALAMSSLTMVAAFQLDTIKSAAAAVIPDASKPSDTKAERMHIPAPDCFETTYQLNTEVRASMYVKTNVIDSDDPTKKAAVLEAQQKAAKDPSYVPLPELTLKTGFFEDVIPEKHPQLQLLPKLDVFELKDPKQTPTPTPSQAEQADPIEYVKRRPIAMFSGLVDVSVCLKKDAIMEKAVTQISDDEVMVHTSDFRIIVNEGGAVLKYEQYPPNYENVGQYSYYTGEEMTRLQKLLAPKSTFDVKKKQLNLGKAFNPKILEYFRLQALGALSRLENGKALEEYSRKGIEQYLEQVTERDLSVEFDGSFMSPATVYEEKLEAKGPLTTDVMFDDFVADMEPLGLEKVQ